MRSAAGLTLLETVVAIGICAVVLGGLATVSTSSLRESQQGNHKVQATQVLDTIGRRIAGGLDPALLLAAGDELTLDAETVKQIMNLRAFRDGAFTANVTNIGQLAVGSSRLARYRVDVCYESGSEPRCVSGVTLGRQGGN